MIRTRTEHVHVHVCASAECRVTSRAFCPVTTILSHLVCLCARACVTAVTHSRFLVVSGVSALQPCCFSQWRQVTSLCLRHPSIWARRCFIGPFTSGLPHQLSPLRGGAAVTTFLGHFSQHQRAFKRHNGRSGFVTCHCVCSGFEEIDG